MSQITLYIITGPAAGELVLDNAHVDAANIKAYLQVHDFLQNS